MQVRKYEASTIKEAVDLVKKDLGPDAIILSTREMNSALAAGKKVLITAAVAEQTYQMKKAVESRLSEKEKEKLLNKPARHQRQVINTIYSSLQEKIETKRKNLTGVNYASIPEDRFVDDEDEVDSDEVMEQKLAQIKLKATQKRNSQIASAPVLAGSADKRVKQAVLEAISASEKSKLAVSPKSSELPMRPIVNKVEASRVEELKSEIKRLQALLKNTSPVTTAPLEVSSYSGAKLGVSRDASFMFDKLLSSGFDESTASTILKTAEQQLGENIKKKSILEAYVAKWVLNFIQIVKDPHQGKFHFFVGPRGVGKTSTLVKMASHLVLKERKKVAIISADLNKVGAVDQLRIYSQILNVPFAVAKNSQEVLSAVHQLQNVDYILFDTQGLSLSQMEEIDWIKSLIPSSLGDLKIHLVLSAMMKDEEIYSLSRRFKSIHFNDVLFTNLDQVHRYGFLVNYQKQIGSPYFAFGMGPMIPEDFEWATKERVLDLIFRISKTKWEGEKHD